MVQRAVAALDAHGAHIRHRDLVGLVDFGKASREARFHLVDVVGGKVVIDGNVIELAPDDAPRS